MWWVFECWSWSEDGVSSRAADGPTWLIRDWNAGEENRTANERLNLHSVPHGPIIICFKFRGTYVRTFVELPH